MTSHHLGLPDDLTTGVMPWENRFLVLLMLTMVNTTVWPALMLVTEKLNQNLNI